MHMVRTRLPEPYYERVERAMESMVHGDLASLMTLLEQLIEQTRASDRTAAAFCCMVVAEMRLMEADEVSFDAELLARFREFAADVAARVATRGRCSDSHRMPNGS